MEEVWIKTNTFPNLIIKNYGSSSTFAEVITKKWPFSEAWYITEHIQPVHQSDNFQFLLVLFLSVLTATFPGEPGLAGFIEAKHDGSGGDNWSHKSCKAPVKSSPPTNQHPPF